MLCTQNYDKKRQEKEDKKEKEPKPRPKLSVVLKPKTVGIVPPMVATTYPTTPTSSKRNLTSRLELAETEAKRRRVRSPERRRGGLTRGEKRGGRGPRRRSSRVSMAGKSSPIKIVQLQADRDSWGGQRARNASPRKSINPKADMEALFLAAGLEVCI